MLPYSRSFTAFIFTTWPRISESNMTSSSAKRIQVSCELLCHTEPSSENECHFTMPGYFLLSVQNMDQSNLQLKTIIFIEICVCNVSRGSCGDPKRVSDPPKLDLQAYVRCWDPNFCKSSTLNCLQSTACNLELLEFIFNLMYIISRVRRIPVLLSRCEKLKYKIKQF